MRKPTLATIIALAGTITLIAAATAQQPSPSLVSDEDAAPGIVGDATYYLALGDSVAAGWQVIGDPEDDHKTRMGYADQFWLMARQWYPNLRLVNLACPGDNTEKIQVAHDRCRYEHGSQLDEGLAFIEEHLEQLAFITIDIGFNDFDCIEELSCLFPGIERISERLPPILAALKEAAPDVPIVGMNIYDPYLTLWFDEDQRTLARQSVVAIQIINETLEEAYAEAGIPVADVESAFAIDDWDTLVPLAGHVMVPRNLGLICERTWQCFPPPLGPDWHPNVLGFRVMADAFADELDLEA